MNLRTSLIVGEKLAKSEWERETKRERDGRLEMGRLKQTKIDWDIAVG